MSRVLVVCPDYVKREMAGPAIRYFELSRQLHAAGHEVTLTQPGVSDLPDPGFPLLQQTPELVEQLCREADVVIVQGWVLEGFPFLRDIPGRLVVDLYCPFYLEGLVDREGNTVSDQVTFSRQALEAQLDQVRFADFFICASEKQRDYWLGVLTATNRINPLTYADDRSLRSLIAVVPFGMPEEKPVRQRRGIRDKWPQIGADDLVILWGSSIYNWFDPQTMVRAIDMVKDELPSLRFVVMASKHSNPTLAQATHTESDTRRLSAELGLTDKHVFFNDGWVPYDQRADWLLDADVGASVAFEHIEGHFSFRVRLLDYLWAELPILCNDGDVLAEAVVSNKIGVTFPPKDVEALAQALREIADPALRQRLRKNIKKLARTLTWRRAAEPLLRYAADPKPAPDLASLKAEPVMPIPIRIYTPDGVAISANGTGTHDWRYHTRRDWRYYLVKGANVIAYEGLGQFFRKAYGYSSRRIAGGS